MALLMEPVLLLLLTLDAASSFQCSDGLCQRLYGLLSADSLIDTSDVSEVRMMTSSTRCAVYCTSQTWCVTYGVKPAEDETASCYFSSVSNPATSAELGSSVYAAVDDAPELAVPCTDPPLDNSSLYECNGSPTFEAAAMLRMGSNRAIVFTSTNTYIKCSSMNSIVEQGAEYCYSALEVVGDADIDRNGDRFATGPPDGAVGYIQSNMVDCRYYLFKDDVVYCYQHMDDEPWMTPCTSWTSMTIQERFGSGIPSNIDDVFGNFDYSYDFYFVKGNQVYLSTGNSTAGSLASGYPKHIHDVVPTMICDITGVQLGLSDGEYYYTKGKNVYQQSNGVVYYKKYLCNS